MIKYIHAYLAFHQVPHNIAQTAAELIAPSQVEALDEIEIIGTIRTNESLTLLLDSFIADYKLEGDKALETLRRKLIA